MADARLTVATALLKLRRDEGYSNIVIDGALHESGLNGRDKAFACALFYGVIERQLTLDHIIKQFCTPKKRIKPAVRVALQIGLYQLLYMDKVPESAAVNESVRLAERLGQPAAAGLVNAVLRTFLRSDRQYELPKDNIEALSIKYSCDEDIIRKLVNDYGERQTCKILDGFERRDSAVTLRVNTLKISVCDFLTELKKRGIRAEKSGLCDTAVLVYSAGDIRSVFGYNEGYFHVQDISSQLCARALGAMDGMRVLDLCAAPGGKAFSIAEIMEDRGEVVACDKYPAKVKIIKDGARRLGLNCIQPTVNDASKFSNNLYNFDRILCDLPCSGIGIMAKKPEIRYKNVALLDKLPELQYHLLRLAADYLKAGGVMVYSTCTLFKSENIKVCERFLKERQDYEPYPILPEIQRAINEPENMLTLLPSFHNTDGFFISAFVRKERT